MNEDVSSSEGPAGRPRGGPGRAPSRTLPAGSHRGCLAGRDGSGFAQLLGGSVTNIGSMLMVVVPPGQAIPLTASSVGGSSAHLLCPVYSIAIRPPSYGSKPCGWCASTSRPAVLRSQWQLPQMPSSVASSSPASISRARKSSRSSSSSP